MNYPKNQEVIIMSSVKQEFIDLVKDTPDSTIQLLIDLLHELKLATVPDIQTSAPTAQRVGAGRGVINLPDDFFDHFDDSNEEIADMFYGTVV